MTKYEREQAAIEKRGKHEANIMKLRNQIREAKSILEVVKGSDYDAMRERAVVNKEIEKLSSFLEDEERAYKATFEASETEVDDVVSKMQI